MQLQNSMEACFVKVSYVKGLTALLRKILIYEKWQRSMALISNWSCYSSLYVLYTLYMHKLRPGIFFLLYYILEIGSHIAQDGLFPNESKDDLELVIFLLGWQAFLPLTWIRRYWDQIQGFWVYPSAELYLKYRCYVPQVPVLYST